MIVRQSVCEIITYNILFSLFHKEVILFLSFDDNVEPMTGSQDNRGNTWELWEAGRAGEGHTEGGAAPFLHHHNTALPGGWGR